MIRHYFFYPILVAFVLISSSQIKAQQQSENYLLWKAAVERKIAAGNFEGFHAEDDIEDGLSALEKNGAICPEVDEGYGTPGWNPNSSPSTDNADPACTINNNLVACNGGKYRFALRNVIFECPSWSGQNFTETGGGFRPLDDQDLNDRFAELNEILANANIELVEVERTRITDCDMYDFYFNKWGKDPNKDENDGVNDETQINAYDQLNVINLYWVGGFNNNHGCCGPLGFIDKLPTPKDYGIMKYSASVNPSSMLHDVSHYFGIYHPHWNLEEGANVKTGLPDGALNNSDCLTRGDGICDTWPGVALEYRCDENCQGGTGQLCFQNNDCSFNMSNYQCVNGQNLQIHPDEGTEIDTYTSTILSYNIATYNAFECRQQMTPCQYYKMNRIARTCRNHICIQEPDQYFLSQEDYDKEISSGDAIPSFVAGRTHTTFDGSSYDVDCFNWYLNENDTDAQAVLLSSSTFDPSPYVNGDGTYTFYLSEVNSMNNPPCKIPVTLKIGQGTGGGGSDGGNDDCTNPLPGETQGTIDYTFSSGTNTIPLSTTGASLTGQEEVLWWISRDKGMIEKAVGPNSLNNRLSNAAINPANDGSGIVGDASVIFQASNLGSGLVVDCANLTPGAEYFATPFVGVATTTQTGGGSGASCSGDFTYANAAYKGDPLRVAILGENKLSCASAAAPTYTILVNVSNYTGSNDNFRMYFVPANSRNVIKLVQSGGNGTFIFNETDLDGYDPNPDGLRIAVLEEDGDGGQNVELDVTIDITYGSGGTPTTETTVSATFSDCLFGTPVRFRCNASANGGGSLEGRMAFAQKALKIYPSPNNGTEVNVSVWGMEENLLLIQIFDLKGALVLERKERIAAGNNQINLALPQLNTGIYMMKTIQQGQVENARFSVAN
ncbi:MAG: T9SS type A sorting domain-containing protein [Bacteroidota bacterium]